MGRMHLTRRKDTAMFPGHTLDHTLHAVREFVRQQMVVGRGGNKCWVRGLRRGLMPVRNVSVVDSHGHESSATFPVQRRI